MINAGFIIAVICALSGFLGGLGVLVIPLLNRKRFRMVCELYEQRFGTLPVDTRVFGNSYGPLGVSNKMRFIYKPLIFNKIPRDMFSRERVDDREFIRNLPKHIRYWFILEFYWPVVFFAIALLCFFVLKFFFKDWIN